MAFYQKGSSNIKVNVTYSRHSGCEIIIRKLNTQIKFSIRSHMYHRRGKPKFNIKRLLIYPTCGSITFIGKRLLGEDTERKSSTNG